MVFYTFLILGIILIGLEIMTPGTFIFFNIGIASIIVAFLSYFSQNLPFLIISLVGISFALYFFMKKFSLFKVENFKTNVENYIGKEAVVLKILGDGKYRVKVFSEEWNAISDENLSVGDKVTILKIEGTNLKVSKEVK